MCRWCQRCWENFYWNCFEEKFCYDESIAKYNPDDDLDYKIHSFSYPIVEGSDRRNKLHTPITIQPLGHEQNSTLSPSKIHEEDYRRETQTNVPMLGPEILAVFANSQIFQDHQPTKYNRISTKSFVPAVHSSHRDTPSDRETDQDFLLHRLEGTDDCGLVFVKHLSGDTPKKHIRFSTNSQQYPQNIQNIDHNSNDNIEETRKYQDEVVLRPHVKLHQPGPRELRNANSPMSLPPFKNGPIKSYVKRNDSLIYSISGKSVQISMTPEVPSIAFNILPKNYEDTPEIEKYRASQSLYSIQTANSALMSKDDYSMPRYFQRSIMISHRPEQFQTVRNSSGNFKSNVDTRGVERGKNNRLQMLRSKLPPLLIHTVSFRKSWNENKPSN